MNNHIFPLTLYIEDTDYFGVIYHSNFLKFFERARSTWLAEYGLGTDWQQEQKLLFAIRSAKLDFIKPARLGMAVEVVSRISQLKKASIVFEQYLRLAATTDTILCKAEIKVVGLDIAYRPRELPNRLIEVINMGETA